LNPIIAELSQAVERGVEECPEAQRLPTHPGVGSLTALTFVLIIGEAERLPCGKQVASYLGLVHRRTPAVPLGVISKNVPALLAPASGFDDFPIPRRSGTTTV